MEAPCHGASEVLIEASCLQLSGKQVNKGFHRVRHGVNILLVKRARLGHLLHDADSDLFVDPVSKLGLGAHTVCLDRGLEGFSQEAELLRGRVQTLHFVYSLVKDCLELR